MRVLTDISTRTHDNEYDVLTMMSAHTHFFYWRCPKVFAFCLILDLIRMLVSV